MPKGPRVTEEEIEYILENYQTTDTTEMAIKLGRSKGSVRAIYSREQRKKEDALYGEA